MDKSKFYARDFRVIPANNGFIIQLGCKHLVKEGSKEDLFEDLGKYLDLDEEIVNKYKYTGGDAFFHLEPCPAECSEGEPKDSREESSAAYSYLRSDDKSSGLTKTLTVYEVFNGLITVDHRKRTAIVRENGLDNNTPEDD